MLNPLDPLLGYQLRRASAVVLADLGRSLVDLALRPADASVILLIADNPGITQSQIGRALGIQRANMTPLVAVLGDRGIVEREREAADGRRQPLRLSASGAVLAVDIRARIGQHEARFLPDLSAANREALTALLRKVWAD